MDQDNSPVYTALSIKKFLANFISQCLTICLNGLTWHYVTLISKVKFALNGIRFETVEAVREKASRDMNELTEEEV